LPLTLSVQQARGCVLRFARASRLLVAVRTPVAVRNALGLSPSYSVRSGSSQESSCAWTSAYHMSWVVAAIVGRVIALGLVVGAGSDARAATSPRDPGARGLDSKSCPPGIWTICESRLGTLANGMTCTRPRSTDRGPLVRHACASSNENASGQKDVFAPLRPTSGASAPLTTPLRIRADGPAHAARHL